MCGKGIADAMASLFIATIIISAVVGWGVIVKVCFGFSVILTSVSYKEDSWKSF